MDHAQLELDQIGGARGLGRTGALPLFLSQANLTPPRSIHARQMKSHIPHILYSTLDLNEKFPSVDNPVAKNSYDIDGDIEKLRSELETLNTRGFKSYDIGEYPSIALCTNCRTEVVTVVKLEKAKGDNLSQQIEYFLCSCLPVFVFCKKNLVHKCPRCTYPIAVLHL